MRRPYALMTAAAVTAWGLAFTPAASPATIEAGTLHSLGQTSPAAQSSNIQRTEVCFTVHVIGDPSDQWVSGTLFHDQNYTDGGTALLLQHGSVSERTIWDGGRPTITGVPSMAEQLAAAGYDVFAIDRLGYGRSPYLTPTGGRGSGWALTMDSYIEMTHEMVTQIRAGAYKITDDACPGSIPAGRPASKVVLFGQSGSSIITEGYATRYHDIDGIVPTVMSAYGSSWGFTEYLFVETLEPQFAQGKDYVYVFWGPGGTPDYSQSCEKWLFYAGGVSEGVVQQMCGPGYFGGAEPQLMPSGDISTQAAMMTEINFLVGNVGPTPALLVYADKDLIFPPAGLTTGPFGEPEDKITGDMEYWTTNPGCNCDVEFIWQRNSGHVNFFHDSAPQMTADVIEWLRSRGL
jgi:pimeloyl-ACP methyl ester carboxylesterase